LFKANFFSRKDANHDSELTDIERSLLREPWQLEYWDLQQAVKRRYCAPPVEVVSGVVFQFPRSFLLDGGDPRFPGWGVAWLELFFVLFFSVFCR
jgi:hypothetical protein